MNLKELLFTDVKELRKKKEKAEAPAPEPVATPKVDEAVAEEPRKVEPGAIAPAAEEPPKPKAPRARKPKAPRVRKPKLDVSKLLPPKPDAKAAKPAPSKPPKASKPPRIKAPRVSTPDIKLPPTVAGAIDNLRERGLLPVALLLVAAIVAVPFLLSGGSSSPPPKSEPTAAATDEAIETQQAVVLADSPGVREYKRRLDGSPKDPFVQQFQNPASGGGGEATGVEQVGGGTGSVEPTGTGGGTGGAAATPTGSKAPSGGLYHYGADIYVSVAGKKNPKLWKNVKRATPIPNENVKVAAFVGVPIDRPNVATFLVSSDVLKIAGKGRCTLGDDGCELISIKIGEQVKLTAPSGVTYSIKLADTYIVHDDVKSTSTP